MKQPNIMALCDKSFLKWFDKYIEMEEMHMKKAQQLNEMILGEVITI